VVAALISDNRATTVSLFCRRATFDFESDGSQSLKKYSPDLIVMEINQYCAIQWIILSKTLDRDTNLVPYENILKK
jgi:hypothetical protein